MTVVGGGLVGLLAALHASHRGCSVRVLERARFGEGSTGWSLGLCPPLARMPAVRALAVRSRAFYATVAGAASRPVRELPLLVVADEVRIAELRQRSLGSGLIEEPVAIEQLKSAYPDVRVAPGERVLRAGEPALVVDPTRLIALLVERLQAAGAECWPGCEAVAVRPHAGSWVIDLRSGRSLRADQVLLALGPRLALGPLRQHVSSPLRCKRIVALHVEADPTPACAVLFPRDDLFLLPDANAALVAVSIFRDAYATIENDLETALGESDVTAGQRAVAARSPALADAVIGGRASYDAYTPIRTPLLELLQPGLAVAGGCSGAGVGVAPALAAGAVDLLLPDSGNV